jgi:DNA-binding response OmpR family regulator
VSRPYTALEWAGFEHTVKALLQVQIADAKMLTALVRAAGRTLSFSQLASIAGERQWKNPAGAACVFVGRARRALDDVGVPDSIRSDPGIGYRVEPSAALAIRNAVEDFADPSNTSRAA